MRKWNYLYRSRVRQSTKRQRPRAEGKTCTVVRPGGACRNEQSSARSVEVKREWGTGQHEVTSEDCWRIAAFTRLDNVGRRISHPELADRGHLIVILTVPTWEQRLACNDHQGTEFHSSFSSSKRGKELILPIGIWKPGEHQASLLINLRSLSLPYDAWTKTHVLLGLLDWKYMKISRKH